MYRKFNRAQLAIPIGEQRGPIVGDPLGDQCKLAPRQRAADNPGHRTDRHNCGIGGVHAVSRCETDLHTRIVPRAPARTDPNRHGKAGITGVKVCHLDIVWLVSAPSLNDPLRTSTILQGEPGFRHGSFLRSGT